MVRQVQGGRAKGSRSSREARRGKGRSIREEGNPKKVVEGTENRVEE